MEKQKIINRFNIRVYGIALKNKHILTLFETYVGEKLIKFPGGGLEFGESITDCLHRELMEELNVKITNIRHFYTQEEFLVSKFRDNEQLLTLYYLIDLENENELKINDDSIEKVQWIPLDKTQNPFTLPIDKIVYNQLLEKIK